MSGKLTLSLVLFIFVFLASTLGLSFLSAKKALYRQFDQTLRAQASLSFRWIEQRDDELRVHERSIRELSPFGENSRGNGQTVLEVLDWRGVVVSSIRAGGVPALALDRALSQESDSWNIDQAGEVPMRAIAQRFAPRLDSEHDKSYPRRDAVLVLASDRTRVDAAVREQGMWLAGIGACIVGITAFMVPFIIRRSMDPLDSLAQKAEAIQATDLDERFPRTGIPRELLPINDCLNRLLERLDRSFRRERNFTSDVAHELLTPVAEMRSLAEFALRYPEEDRDESIAQTLEILKRVEGIIGTLLDLCRVEQEGKLPTMEPISVRPLVEEILANHKDMAASRKISLELGLPVGASILANSDRLKVVLNNLISNAVSYADEGTLAKICWTESDSEKRLSVVNVASSLSEDELGSLFERFWRQDSSRAASGHFGLGLSLSKELAVSMQLGITAELSKSGYLSVSIVA